jgi:predicted nucleic acid-binding protein
MKKIFIDTNIFLNLLLNKANSEKIYKFLDNKENDYYTNTIVLNELRFQLLIQQASEKLKSNKKNDIIKFIKTNKTFRHEILSKYISFFINLKNIVNILNISLNDEIEVCSISIKYGLLPSDASIINSMYKNKINYIYTTDKDFNNIENINVISL